MGSEMELVFFSMKYDLSSKIDFIFFYNNYASLSIKQVCVLLKNNLPDCPALIASRTCVSIDESNEYCFRM
jgi:hypothetical protein